MASKRSWVWDGAGFHGKELRNLTLLVGLLAAVILGGAALFWGPGVVSAWGVLIWVCLPPAFVAYKLGHVRLGVDRLTRRGVRGFSVHMGEILSFRFTPRGMWYVETARGLHPLGAGARGQRLVDAIYAAWPHLPRPSPTRLEAAQAGGFRRQSIDVEELRATLRLPNLPDDERVRVAELVAHDREGVAEVEAVAEACLDPALKGRLLATVRRGADAGRSG